MLDKTI